MGLQMFTESGPFAAVSNIIAVAAGKGGVGKSTISVNLALALREAGHQVGILDTDIYGPSVRRMLPEDKLPGKVGDKLSPALSHGIRLISMAYFRKEDEGAVIRAPIANQVIMQFISQIDWGKLDYLIVDFPPGTGDIQLTLAQQCKLTCAIMVTTPQELALMDVKKAMHLFREVNVPIAGVVENMAYYAPEGSSGRIYPFGQGGGKRLARDSGIPLLAEIPLEPLLCTCSDQGTSIFRKLPSGEVSGAFRSLASMLSSHIETLKDSSTPSQEFNLQWKEMAEK